MHGPVWEQTLVQRIPPARGRFYQHYCCGSSLKTNVGSHISGRTCMRFTTLQPAAPQHRLLNPSFPRRGRWLLRHGEVSVGWDLFIIYRSNCFREHALLSKLQLEVKLHPQNWSSHPVPPLAIHGQRLPSETTHQWFHLQMFTRHTEVSSESQQLALSSWA